MYGLGPKQSESKRETIARLFVTSWAQRHPDFALWESQHTPSTLAVHFENDPEFPGLALIDALGRPDVRAIQYAVASLAWAPNGTFVGVDQNIMATALAMATERSGASRRRGWIAVSLLALVVGAVALISNSPTRQPSSEGVVDMPPEKRRRKSQGEQSVPQTKRVFIAFAKEDERIRDLIKGQSLNDATPFEYVDMSVKEPYSSEWKDRVRTRIRGSDGVIALLSRSSLTAAGELWEIQCAVEERKPLLGLYIYKDDTSKPAVMGNALCIVWTWAGIGSFINGL